MRILYYHQHFTTPSQAGGTRSYELAKQLIKRGHDVTMVCGGGSNLNLSPTKDKMIRRGPISDIDVIQINLPYSNDDGIFKRTITFTRFAMKGIRIAFKEDYDLLFATSTPLTAGIPGIFVKWFKGNKKKFVFEVRDLWPELPKALGMKNPFLLQGMSLLEKLSYKKADACIGLSPGICKGITKKSKKHESVSMIPNGCDIDFFKPGKREDLHLDNVSDSDTVAIFTGAHGIANGLDSILDAAKEIIKLNRNDIKIVFIGDGKMKKHLLTRKEEENIYNCLFIAPIPKLQLKEIVASADIGLMVLANVPAFYYGTSPNKFFDYISSGLPVINNYPGWLTDLITEYKCGVAVPPDNPKELAHAIIGLADNKTLREILGTNSRSLAQKKFAREILANKFVDFIEAQM